MADWPNLECKIIAPGVAVLENRDNILYGLVVEGEGILFLRIVTVDEQTGRVELRCSLGEGVEA